MRTVRLAHIIEESRSGFWGSEAGAESADVRVIRNGDIQGSGVRWGSLPLRSVSESEAGRAAIRKGDVLMTTSGNCGYSAYISEAPTEPTIASNFVRILRFNSDTVVPRYIFHIVCSDYFRSRLSPFIRGTTLQNLSLATAVERIDVPLPDITEQRRIAEILDKADTLRAKRRAALARLDTLAQSIFLDMFGDPATNPKGWPVTLLRDLLSAGPQNGLYKPASEYGSGTPILRIDGFYNGRVTSIGTLKRVRISDEEQSLYGLHPGEIVINRVNSREYLGKTALIPALTEPTVFESNMMRFDIDRTRLDPGYLIQFLQTQHVRAHILKSAKDAVNQSSINQQDVKALLVVVPPLPMQQLFVRRCELVARYRSRNEDSLKALTSLFSSLQRRAFQGEL